MKLVQEFDLSKEVAPENQGWLWMQINVGHFTDNEGNEFQVQFSDKIRVMNKEGNVIVSVSIMELVEQMSKECKK